jgi:hypothetical protein
MRDNYGNHKIFEIKSSKLPVIPVNELLNDTSTTAITVYYLCFKSGYGIKNILSELYYRNKLGNSYSDTDNNKLESDFIKNSDGEIVDSYIDITKPIFKNKQGKRLILSKNLQINPDKIVRYLKCTLW